MSKGQQGQEQEHGGATEGREKSSLTPSSCPSPGEVARHHPPWTATHTQLSMPSATNLSYTPCRVVGTLQIVSECQVRS